MPDPYWNQAAAPSSVWDEEPSPPTGEDGFHLLESGGRMLYEDEDDGAMLLDSSGTGLWVEQPPPPLPS